MARHKTSVGASTIDMHGDEHAMKFILGREAQKGSRLQNQVGRWKREQATMRKSWSAAALEKLQAQEKEQGQVEYAPPPTPPQEQWKDGEIPQRWYPHPTHNRGLLKLCKPRALDWGIDCTKDQGYRCPFWEAEVHRFDKVAKMPEAKPVTPTRSLRWRSNELWHNPDMHHPYKLTQHVPKHGLTATMSQPDLS
mmetsp:Transcript_39673/g.63024  ORF Transcript_39673/g.63024 Transcript_39673/m.63024 type:complete len:194 (-) Transcript_39673:122-703(-)